jgi:hypothetical protein
MRLADVNPISVVEPRSERRYPGQPVTFSWVTKIKRLGILLALWLMTPYAPGGIAADS